MLTMQTFILRKLHQREYTETLQAMQEFTQARTSATTDEIWWVEHPPVYTQGLAGKPEHILHSGSIPVIQTDRGGQVTYHGPGQLVLYLLVDIKRKQLTIRKLVCAIEQAVIRLLLTYNIKAYAKPNAPGVYIDDAKIAALGLRIRKGCSYHGLSFNIDMDLEPFSRINPCGFKHLKIVQLKDFLVPPPLETLAEQLADHIWSQISSFTSPLTPLKGYCHG